MARRKLRPALVAGLGLALVLCGPHVASAGVYDVSKVIFWDTEGMVGDETGHWRASLHVFAGERIGDNDVIDHKGLGVGPPVDNSPPLLISLISTEQPHPPWTVPVGFDQGATLQEPAPPPPPPPPVGGLDLLGAVDTLAEGGDPPDIPEQDPPAAGDPPQMQAISRELSAMTPRADSDAHIQLTTVLPGDPVGMNFPADQRPAGSTAAIVRATGSTTVEEGDEVAKADSYAAGQIALTGGQLTEFENSSGEFEEFVSKATFGFLSGFDTPSSRASHRDPIQLVLMDEATNAVVREEDLYQEMWRIAGPASVQWSLAGLTLVADPAGFAEVVLDTLSDWIVTPIDGSASLTNGVFSATGDLENLGWIVGVSGGRTTAFLPSSEMSPFFDFAINATGLTDLPESVIMRLIAQEEGFAAAATVPEPHALPLMVTGLLGLMLTARRRARSGRFRASVPASAPEVEPS